MLGLIECETFWPTDDRNALVTRVKAEDYPKLTELACWVWQQRFLQSGFEHLLGGWIFLDMLQRTFEYDVPNPHTNTVCNLNIFSGHDYTILALLAIDPSFMPVLKGPIEFGSYVIFELWDSKPPPLHSDIACQQDGSASSSFPAVSASMQVVYDALYSSVSVFADALQAVVCNDPNAGASAGASASASASQPQASGTLTVETCDDGQTSESLMNMTTPTPTTATSTTVSTPSPTQGGAASAVSPSVARAFADYQPTPTRPEERAHSVLDMTDSSKSTDSEKSKRVLRIILNQRAFQRRSDLFGVDTPRVPNTNGVGYVPTVRDDRAVVLADLNMSQVRSLTETVVASLSSLHSGLPSHFRMPQFE
jgi:hypothetical protein